MTRRHIGILILLVILLLSACSGKDKYEPFTELSKKTVSPERDASIQAALHGQVPTPTPALIFYPTEEPITAPSFDEDSFFSEIPGENAEPTEAPVLKSYPTDTPVPAEPTATPMPTATKPYDPDANMFMYGTTNGQTTYTMQDGDYLICLARRFNVSLGQLMSQNGIDNPDALGVGDIVVLPRNPSPWSLIDGYGRRTLIIHPANYVTQTGDTLFSIACSYGDVLPEEIAKVNKLYIGDPLPAGKTITIP